MAPRPQVRLPMRRPFLTPRIALLAIPVTPTARGSLPFRISPCQALQAAAVASASVSSYSWGLNRTADRFGCPEEPRIIRTIRRNPDLRPPGKGRRGEFCEYCELCEGDVGRASRALEPLEACFNRLRLPDDRVGPGLPQSAEDQARPGRNQGAVNPGAARPARAGPDPFTLGRVSRSAQGGRSVGTRGCLPCPRHRRKVSAASALRRGR